MVGFDERPFIPSAPQEVTNEVSAHAGQHRRKIFQKNARARVCTVLSFDLYEVLGASVAIEHYSSEQLHTLRCIYCHCGRAIGREHSCGDT